MDLNFTPEVWPEDKMPLDAANYMECEVCTPKSRIIWGEGNPKAPVIIILDNPGAREDNEGKQYVCGTRADDVYLTYLLKCRPLRSYDKQKARSFSKPFLERQIRTIQPRYIVCLGDT